MSIDYNRSKKCPRNGIVGNVFYHNVSAQIPEFDIVIDRPGAHFVHNFQATLCQRLHDRGMLVWYWRRGPRGQRLIYGPEPRNPATGRIVPSAFPHFSRSAIEKLYRRWWHGWMKWVQFQEANGREFVDRPYYDGGDPLTSAEEFRDALIADLD